MLVLILVGMLIGRLTAPGPPPDVVELWDFRGKVVDRPDRGDPSTWDWTPAIAAAVARCRELGDVVATGPGGADARARLPVLHLARGVYRNTATHLVEYVRGFTVRGDGLGATVIRHEGRGVLFDVHRSAGLDFSGFTVEGVDPAGPSGRLRGLAEGSGAFRFRESAEDAWPGGGATLMVHAAVEVNEVATAFSFEGDTMTDSVVIDRYRGRDNFVDFAYANSNALNHQLFGGEVVYGLTWPDADYRARLASWSTHPQPEDGAVFDVRAGGQVSVFGGSVIARKPTVFLHRTPPDGSHGTPVNVNPFNFDGTRWEWRQADTGGDRFGLQRVTLVRYEEPWPADASVQASVRFVACDWLLQAPALDLVQLADSVRVEVVASRVQYAAPGLRARLLSLLSPATAASPGTYHSWSSTPLEQGAAAAPGFVPPPGLAHRVAMDAG